jgi:RNA polymerase sigma-70 factor, ECF subfamily
MNTPNIARIADWDATSDEAIVARLVLGETALFEVLMRRHNQRLFRAARAIVRDDDEAEDVMQEAYVQAFTKLSRFEGRSKFSTWLTRIAIHEALARVRKRRPEVDADAEPMLSDMPSPEDVACNVELAGLLEPLVDALPEAFRVVFVLRAAEGLSSVECAECLGIPEETVRTRFFRARRMLQLEIEQKLLASGAKLYEFHLRRCDRVVAAVFARIET